MENFVYTTENGRKFEVSETNTHIGASPCEGCDFHQAGSIMCHMSHELVEQLPDCICSEEAEKSSTTMIKYKEIHDGEEK